jgi:hypothetical protein
MYGMIVVTRKHNCKSSTQRTKLRRTEARDGWYFFGSFVQGGELYTSHCLLVRKLCTHQRGSCFGSRKASIKGVTKYNIYTKKAHEMKKSQENVGSNKKSVRRE